jgi:hypothetical protein
MNRVTLVLIMLLGVFLAGSLYLAWQGSRQTSVLVEWETASELDTAGFNLYRGPNTGGPFERVNDELIPTKGDPLSGGNYTYEDTSVRAGRVVYYQLEEVRLDGSSQRFGPISVEARAWVPVLAVPALAIISLILALTLVWNSVLRRRRNNHSPRLSGEEHV